MRFSSREGALNNRGLFFDMQWKSKISIDFEFGPYRIPIVSGVRYAPSLPEVFGTFQKLFCLVKGPASIEKNIDLNDLRLRSHIIPFLNDSLRNPWVLTTAIPFTDC